MTTNFFSCGLFVSSVFPLYVLGNSYGLLYAPDGTANTSRLMSPQGTDLIVTYGEGQIAAYSPGDIAWILTCTALVFLMIPGLGYLYSGLARRKNALHVLMITIVALAIVTLQWFLGGYSLVFAPESSNFWGTLKNFGYMKVLQEPVAASNNKLPNIVFSMYEVRLPSSNHAELSFLDAMYLYL